MPSTPPDIGQPAREAGTGREDRDQRGSKWWTLVAVCLGTFMLLLDITIVNVALPDIQRALHSSVAGVAGQRLPRQGPRPQAAGLQRRLGGGVRAQRLHLLGAALPRAVPAGHPGLLAFRAF